MRVKPTAVYLAAKDARIAPWDSELGAKVLETRRVAARRLPGSDMSDPWTGEIAGPYCRSL